MFTHDLTFLPDGCAMRSVTARPDDAAGRRALRVELDDRVTFGGRPGVDFVDQPTFVLLPVLLTDGLIEVDVLARLNGKGPDDARGFAGLAFHIQDSGDAFEAVYLRGPERHACPAARTPRPAGHSVLRLPRLALRQAPGGAPRGVRDERRHRS